MDLVSFVSALRNALVEMGIQPRNVAAKGTVCSGRTLVRAARSTVIRRVGPYPLVAIFRGQQIGQELQSRPGSQQYFQQYVGVVLQVANTCNNY